MFIRQKKNKSGSVSVQILEKVDGKNKLIKSLGSAIHQPDIDLLIKKASLEIPKLQGQRTFNFGYASKDSEFLHSLKNSRSIKISVIGPQLVLGKIFDRIGFNEIPEDLFKGLVITRIINPVSKLKTTDYWRSHNDIDVSVQTVYRFLDRLNSDYKERVEQISYNYTKEILGEIKVVFYDMTTLYFEISEEDDLRKIGFSKDGKFQKPQILLGLLVGEEGYPIGYDIYEGNTFEGKTMIPFIERLQSKYGFNKPIIVADSGLLSNKNIEELKAKQYQFIIGARIKNESAKIKQEILEKTIHLKNGETVSIQKEDTKLVVSYSSKRAKKDQYNREKGIGKLKIKIHSGKLTKESINNRGYNKFLKLKNTIAVELDDIKIEEDKKWDGLKGYITNTKLSNDNVIENYQNLWKIEKAFRISKNDLRIRPIFHYKQSRIEAHICLSFVAYTIYKELERLLKKNKSKISITKAIESLDSIYEVTIKLPVSNIPTSVLADLTDDQQEVLRVTQC